MAMNTREDERKMQDVCHLKAPLGSRPVPLQLLVTGLGDSHYLNENSETH